MGEILRLMVMVLDMVASEIEPESCVYPRAGQDYGWLDWTGADGILVVMRVAATHTGLVTQVSHGLRTNSPAWWLGDERNVEDVSDELFDFIRKEVRR